MKTKKATRGMNLRDALGLARRLGCRVWHRHAADELYVAHPDRAWLLRISNHRSDSPRNLTSKLGQLLRQRKGGAK